MKHWLAVLCSAMLAGCVGGGDTTPRITDIQVTNLNYGVNASFEFIGANLDGGFSVDVPKCANQTPAYVSSTQQVMTCTLTATGDLTVKVRSGSGEIIFSKAFTVPAPQVLLATSATSTASKGTIIVELDPTAAPLSANNFLQYVGSGFYTNTIFHRVIANFVVQGGGYTTGPTVKTGLRAPIALESNNGLTNQRGTVAMARTVDPISATSQFYFNLVDNPTLDYKDASNPGYAVFGRIVQGLDVMDAIGAVPTSAQGGLTDVPVTDVVVKGALRIQ